MMLSPHPTAPQATACDEEIATYDFPPYTPQAPHENPGAPARPFTRTPAGDGSSTRTSSDHCSSTRTSSATRPTTHHA